MSAAGLPRIAAFGDLGNGRDFIRATGGCGAVHEATGAACWLSAGHRSSHEAPRPVPGLTRREQAEREIVVWWPAPTDELLAELAKPPPPPADLADLYAAALRRIGCTCPMSVRATGEHSQACEARRG